MRLKEKIELANFIRSRFDGQFVVVERPEHPYLDEPPDLLIGGEGLLTALFFPNFRERRTPKLLRARLTAARLALPDNTRCVYLKPDDIAYSLATPAQDIDTASLQRDFEAIIPVSSRSGIIDIARDANIQVLRRDELIHQRISAAKRSSIALTLSQIARRRETINSVGEATTPHVDSWMKNRLLQLAAPGTPFRAGISRTGAWPKRARMQPYSRGEQMLMWADGNKKAHGLSLAIRTAFLNEFILDTGVPYAASSSIPVVFLERGIPEGRLLETNILAASLAGLAIAPSGQPELVEKFIELTDIARDRRLRRADLVDWLDV